MGEIANNRVTEILKLHNEVEESMNITLNKAIRIGELLIQVKAELKHGEFTPWINDNLTFSQRTAQRYIKLFENKDKALNADTVTEVYKMLETPKSDTVSFLDADLSDSAMWLGNWLDIAQEGETVTGVNIKSNNDKITPPRVITVMKRENDLAIYEMLFWSFDYWGEGHTIHSIEPIPITLLILYLDQHSKYSIGETRWMYPGMEMQSLKPLP